MGRHKKYNNYLLYLKDEYGEYGIGYCTNTNSEFYFDMEDYDKIKNYSWNEHIVNSGYHALESWDSNEKHTIRMHYLIVGKYFDHADRNPLNNRKYNLRKATIIDNARNHSKQKSNTSGIIGVEFNKDNNKWRSSITVDKKRIFLGYFSNKNDAIIARLNAEMYFFQKFAPQQHLFDQYKINGDVQYLNIDNKVRRDNTSGITGVSYDKRRNKWTSSIIINKKYIYLGKFDNIEDAVVARLNAELEYYGQLAPQQYLFEQYKINDKDGNIYDLS